MTTGSYNMLGQKIVTFKTEWDPTIAAILAGTEGHDISFGGFQVSDMLRSMYEALDTINPQKIEFVFPCTSTVSKLIMRNVVDFYNLDIVLTYALDILTTAANQKRNKSVLTDKDQAIIQAVPALHRLLHGTPKIKSRDSRHPEREEMEKPWASNFIALALATTTIAEDRGIEPVQHRLRPSTIFTSTPHVPALGA